jgi:hypothetical protein
MEPKKGQVWSDSSEIREVLEADASSVTYVSSISDWNNTMRTGQHKDLLRDWRSFTAKAHCLYDPEILGK